LTVAALIDTHASATLSGLYFEVQGSQIALNEDAVHGHNPARASVPWPP